MDGPSDTYLRHRKPPRLPPPTAKYTWHSLIYLPIHRLTYLGSRRACLLLRPSTRGTRVAVALALSASLPLDSEAHTVHAPSTSPLHVHSTCTLYMYAPSTSPLHVLCPLHVPALYMYQPSTCTMPSTCTSPLHVLCPLHVPALYMYQPSTSPLHVRGLLCACTMHARGA